MRRKDREMTDRNDIEAILKSCVLCHLGMCDGDRPYVLPLNYGYQDGCVYIHGAGEGQKLDILRQNRNVCVTVERDVAIQKGERPEDCTTLYQSVVAFGKAELVTDEAGKQEGLAILMAQHGEPLQGPLPAAVLARLTVIRVRLDTMTGKRHMK